MSAFHVPSVPRGLLLPGLDTHEARNEEQADPTPAGSHVSASSCITAVLALQHYRSIIVASWHSNGGPRCLGWACSGRNAPLSLLLCCSNFENVYQVYHSGARCVAIPRAVVEELAQTLTLKTVR